MSLQNKSQRTSSQKKRKLRSDLDESSVDHNLELRIDSSFKTKSYLEDNRSHIDLFGEIIPPDVSVNKTDPKNKSVKKMPVSRKRKLPHEESLIDTPVRRPKKLCILTPRMKDAMMKPQKELYSFINKNQNNVSITSTNSFNISGVQHLPESPITTIKNEPKINNEINDNDKKSQQVLKGVVAFVDYKMEKERCSSSLGNSLINLGAKVEKTFNRKVTHVMFCDGYRSTYKKAVERNIPLVSARWMEYSRLANKIQDPADYPPVGMEKYTKTPTKVVKISKLKSYLKFLDQSNTERDQLFKATCDNLMEQFNQVKPIMEIKKCSNNNLT